MLFCTNITKSFGGHTLLQNADFQLNKNERIGIVGRNGAGKSTLFRILLGHDTIDDGDITYPTGYRMRGLSQHMVFDKKNIVEEVAHVLPADQQYDVWKAEKLLSGLGFAPTDFVRPASDFSGGFQIRIKLAELLLSEPDLLLLDEPTNYLDIVAIRWLERFLKSWKGEILCVSHDQRFLENVMTHTVGFHRQKLKKITGSPQKLYTQIAHEEDIHERTRVGDEKETARQEKFIREFRSGARSAGLVQSRIKMLDKKEKLTPLPPIAPIRFSFKTKLFEAARILEARSLSFGYSAGQDLLKKIDLEITPKDKVGIIGANGQGKTTLLRVLNGELTPDAGTIKKHNSIATGYFGQSNIDRLQAGNTIIEEFMLAGQHSEQAVRAMAGNLLFGGDLAYKKIEILSGGEKARVNLGKVMLSHLNMLLLDEPTNHLDYESVEALIQALIDFDGGIVFVSHDEHFLRRVANKLIVFDGGMVYAFAGGYDEFLSTRGFASEIITETSILDEHKAKKSNPLHRQQQKEKERLIRPLRRALQRVEKSISDIETKQMENKEEFDRQEKQGNRMQMDTLGREYFDLQKKLQREYDQWETLGQEIEALEHQYETEA